MLDFLSFNTERDIILAVEVPAPGG